MTCLNLDVNESFFLLSGEFSKITQFKRFQRNLVSYGGELLTKKTFQLPFATFENSQLVDKEMQFEKINKLSKKFHFDIACSQRVNEELEEIIREHEAFEEFSIKALDIRNNNHILGDFQKFTEAVKKNIPTRKLYKLQLLSAYHLAFAQNACNFSVPGAGKTSTVYAAFSYLKSLPETDPKHVNRLLIICPLSAFYPWKSEFELCFDKPPKVKELVGLTPDERTSFFHSSESMELTLISYQSSTSSEHDIINIIDYLKRHKVMVVLDEAHRIKNTTGGKTAEGILNISQHAKSRVVLTGTPAPNGYQDIYNLYKFIWPNSNIIKYTPDFLERLSSSTTPSAKDSIAELIHRISPFFMRIRKSDLGLPEPVHHEPIVVEMDQHHREIYSLIENKFIPKFDRSINDKDSFSKKINKAKLVRLMQCVTNPALLARPLENYLAESYGEIEFSDDFELVKKIQQYSESNIIPSKYIELRKLLQKITSKDGAEGKAIVWTIFVDNMFMLQNYLKLNCIEAELLYGATPNESETSLEEEMTREKIISQFHNPQCPFKVIIANPFAVGESISLHKACRNAIYLEKNFNAAMYMQSKDRVHRYGLLDTEIVHYYHLLSAESIDSDIHNRVLMKEDKMLNLIENEEIPLLSLNMDDHGELASKNDFQSILDGYYDRTTSS